MYFLLELEAVCIGPHTSECTFSNRRLVLGCLALRTALTEAPRLNFLQVYT